MGLLDDVMSMVNSGGDIAKSKQDYGEILANSAAKYGIPDKLPILQRMLQAESGGNPNAKSPKGASGLMQLMPGTARSLGVKNINDPQENIDAGVRYFAEQLKAFGDDSLALAAYNAGPGRVIKANGIPNIKETKNYVNKILAPISGKMGGGFNDPRGDRLHYGGDISAAAGTEFVAPTRLKITHVRDQMSNSPGGMVWGTDPTTGLQFKFHHVMPGVKVGALIEAGQPLGSLSSISGPHLDMKVFDPKKNEYVNWIDSNKLKRGDTFAQGQDMGTIGSPETAAMVADVSGQATPSVPIQQNPQKTQTISDILSGLSQSMGPSEAAAAEPPKSNSFLDEIMKEVNQDVKPEGIRQETLKMQPSKIPPATGGTLEPVNAPDFNTMVNVATVDAPKAKFRLLAKHFFPKMNPDEAAKRFYIDNQGNMLYVDENDQTRKVNPDTLTGKLKGVAADIIGRTPEIAAGMVNPLLTFPASIVRQQIGKSFLGDEPKGVIGEAAEAGKETLGALAGYGIGKGMSAGINKGLRATSRTGELGKIVSQDSPFFNPQEAQRIINEGRKFGIDLTAPEVMNSPTLRALWANLAKTPGLPAERIAKFIEEVRTPQVMKAIQRELDLIHPEKSIFTGGAMAKGAAEGMKESLDTARKTAVSPLYKKAFQSADDVDLNPVIAQVDDLLNKVGPNTDQAAHLTKIRNKLLDKPAKDPNTGDMIEKPLTKLETIHNVKEELDGMFKDQEVLKAFGKRQERNLFNIKDTLLSQMDAASPEYAAARAENIIRMKPLNQLLHGDPNIHPKDKKNAKTLINKLISLDENQTEKAHTIIFDNTSPEQIGAARRWFDASGANDEWNALVRSRLQAKLDKVNNETGNQGAIFRNKVFNTLERQKLKEAMEPAQFKRFSDFMDVLDKTRRIIYTNSETAFQLSTEKAIGENISGWRGIVLDTLKAYGVLTAPFNPKNAKEILTKQWSPQQADKFLTAMIDDPTIARRLSKIKQLPPTAKTVIETGALFSGILGEESIDKPIDIPRQK